jgi:hypothetical protein
VMRKGRIMTSPGHVRLVVHDPVDTSVFEASAEGARALAARVFDTIRADVDEPKVDG